MSRGSEGIPLCRAPRAAPRSCSRPCAAWGDLAKIKSLGLSFWFAPYLWKHIREGEAVHSNFAQRTKRNESTKQYLHSPPAHCTFFPHADGGLTGFKREGSPYRDKHHNISEIFFFPQHFW